MIECRKSVVSGPIAKGKIIGFNQHGAIIVEPDDGGTAIPCYCIRNALSPLPVYAIGDLVAFSAADDGSEGYILGLIEPYITCTEERRTVESGDSELIQLDKKNKRIVFKGKSIKIDADEDIVIVCGKSSLRMSKDGEVTVRGTKLLSRSSGSNKIKGASVMLN
jgi:hypothetical protein